MKYRMSLLIQVEVFLIFPLSLNEYVILLIPKKYINLGFFIPKLY